MSTIDAKRHSLAHLLAAAVLELYPHAKNTIGPAVENGFYYDFDFGTPEQGGGVSQSDLKEIEKKMKKISNSWTGFDKKEVSADEAREIFKDNIYKLELIEEITAKGDSITLYTSGTFTDLCRGGHVETMKEVSMDAFKLSRIAGAYWRGDEHNKMLTRIYGLAFDTEEGLKAYEVQQAEAEKRDHRKLGKELDLFIFSDLVGPGLPLYTPKGNIVRNEIINFSRALNKKIGFEEVHTPNINKAELFKISGHYDKYKDDMLMVTSHYSDEEYFLKPMNCPQHTQIYASRMRSYRDLPIRIADFANLHRDERPGELSGLTRLRYFAQDDGHCFCREDQIRAEFIAILGVIKEALTAYGMEYVIRLSLRDPEHTEKYLGDDSIWNKAESTMRDLLTEEHIPYVEALGEAAFYGPKMDIVVKDALKREWQISTIQLDFNMPLRFKLEYIDSDGKTRTPVMIHRALIGSPDRFMGILIEHFAGAFPLWLSPVQLSVLPIGEAHFEYAKAVYEKLKIEGIRVELDESNESLGKKIRNAKMSKVPYLLVIGDKEMTDGTVTLEGREGTLGALTVEELIPKLKEEIVTKI